jgi:hypothetical protein
MERVMAKWWLRVALTVGGLAVAAPAPAQYSVPGDGGPPGFAPAGYLPAAPGPAALPPAPPGDGGFCAPGADMLGGASVGGPDNAFPEPDCCPHCNNSPCFHFDIDYLAWFTRARDLPALVTSGVATDPFPGASGQPGTRPLLLGSDLNDTFHSGVRATAAVDLGPAKVWAVEASAFILENKVARATFAGNGLPGTPVLARPFFNAATGAEDAIPFAFPNALAGRLDVGLSERLYGGDANVRYNYWRSSGYDGRLDVLVGVRYLGLEEGLTFGQSSQTLTAPGTPGTALALVESLRTTNHFYGGQVGLAYEGNVGAVFLNLLGKFAVGENRQGLSNGALTLLTDPTGTVTTFNNQGLLVQPSNAGRFTHRQTSFVPEVGLTLGYEFSRNVRLAAGYTLIVWTNVLEPERQIDPTMDATTGRPAVNGFQTTTFWAQGVSASLQLSF